MKKTVFLFFLFLLIISYASAEEKRYNVPIDGSPVYGPADAPVTIIEFLDYQ